MRFSYIFLTVLLLVCCVASSASAAHPPRVHRYSYHAQRYRTAPQVRIVHYRAPRVRYVRAPRPVIYITPAPQVVVVHSARRTTFASADVSPENTSADRKAAPVLDAESFAPVCAHDGRTYFSASVAKQYARTVQHDGECTLTEVMAGGVYKGWSANSIDKMLKRDKGRTYGSTGVCFDNNNCLEDEQCRSADEAGIRYCEASR